MEYALSTFLVYVLFCVVICNLLHMYIKEYKRYRHIPGPPRPNIILGHALTLKKAMEAEDMMIQDLLYEWYKKYGLTYKIYILHKVVVITADPAGVKEALLGGHPKADELYKRLVNLYGVRFLGKGLVTLTDTMRWEHRRKAMNPAFRRQFLKGLMEQFNSSSDVLVKKLQRVADGKTKLLMVEEFHRITLDLIGKVAFSMEINSLFDPNSPFPKAVCLILDAMYTQLFKNDFGLNPLKIAYYRKAREAVTFLRQVGYDLIKTRKEQMSDNKEVPEDILTHAIRIAEKDSSFSSESLVDDFITFFIAGHETTANTLSFIVQEIGRRKDVLQKLREEIESVVADEKYLEYEHILKLKYMSMVIKESMRLYPTAPSTFRKLAHNANIGGYHVPAGALVMVSDFVASRNAEIFDDPLSFKPERFDPNTEKKIPIYSFFPFSLGPRSCIGQTFAQIQTKVILTKFLMEFEFELDKNQPFGMKEIATIKPKSNVEVTLLPRSRL